MELINGTQGLQLNATQGLDKEGRPWLVVIAKGTYRIPEMPDARAQIAEKPRGLLTSDVYESEPGLSTPYFESDFVPRKGVCDVVVKGSAHAPKGEPVKEISVGIQVGPIKKLLRVVGERHWIKDKGGAWSVSEPEPFTAMPVTYARAFGGLYTHEAIGSDDPADFLAHPANLIGRGYATGKFLDLLADQPAPNIEIKDQPITALDTLHTPASLGPIARNWAPRVAYAGTYDEHWQEEVFPLLPVDFDERYYQCAPPDQQMPYPEGGEEIALLNLRPGGGITRFTLPKLFLPMVVLARARDQVRLTPVVDTIAIDADAGTFDITWRASMPLKRGLHEVHTVAAGSVCKRWWKSRVYGAEDCGCGGIETNDEDLAPVTEALEEA
jgi:hypothetical protein